MLKSTERVQTEKDFKGLGMGYSIDRLQSWHPLDLLGATSWQHLFQPDGFWLQRIMQNSNECKQWGNVFIRSHNWKSSSGSASRGDKISCSIKLIEGETMIISTNDAGTTECTHTDECKPSPQSMRKNRLKMDRGHECKNENYKASRRKYMRKPSWPWF